MKVKDKVNYKGDNRPYLNETTGEVLNFNSTGTSAQVQFIHATSGKKYTEWVGVSALAVVNDDPIHIAIVALENRLNGVRQDRAAAVQELLAIQSRVDVLDDQMENFVNAITKLRELA
jgi:hypothetical protein